MANQDIYNPEFRRTGPMDERISETPGNTAEAAKQKASEMSSKAEQTWEASKRKTDQARRSAAGSLERMASRVHDTAGRLPGGERTQRAAHAVAGRMERSATYLREHDLSDMRSDVEAFVRRHPGQSLVGAIAAGFLLGMALRRSRD